MRRQFTYIAGGLVLLGLIAGVFRKGAFFGGAGHGARKIQFYQDSMHPWVKSDQPGKCTICAMDLTPILEGQAGFDVGSNLVVLRSNSITVLNVQAAEVKRRTLVHTLRVAGTLEIDETHKAILSAPAPCRIQGLMVEYVGAEVRKGQALLSLFSPELVQKAGYFRNVSNATQGLSLPKTSSDPYSRDIIAPFAGVVVERNVFSGQYVPEGEKLIVLVDPSVLWFRFDVNDRQAGWLQPGQKLEISVPAIPDKVFPAVIAFIEPTLNDQTRTLRVRADVKNPVLEDKSGRRRLLRFGMYAEARIRGEAADVLAVPRTAVLYPGRSAFVHVDQGDGAYERRRVRVGRQGDELWEVLGGLDEGDRVVTSGNVLIDAQAQFNRSSDADEAAVTEEMTPKDPGAAGDEGMKGMDHSAMDHPESGSAEKPMPAQDPGPVNGSARAETMEKPEHPESHSDAKEMKEEASNPGGAAAESMVSTNASGNVEKPATAATAARPPVPPRLQTGRGDAGTNASQAVNPFALPGAGTGDTNRPLSRAQRSSARMASVDEMRRQRISMIVAAREAEAAGAATTGAAPATASTPKTGSPAATKTNKPALMEVSSPTGQKPTNAAVEAGSVSMEHSPEQRKALEDFTREAAGVSKALSADDLAKFNEAATKLPPVIAGLKKAFPDSARVGALIERMAGPIGKGETAKDLAEARKSFLPFSTAVVEMVRELRKKDPAFAKLKVYHCPMAPKPGLWIQSQGPLANPFYGAEMLKCGVEIRE